MSKEQNQAPLWLRGIVAMLSLGAFVLAFLIWQNSRLVEPMVDTSLPTLVPTATLGEAVASLPTIALNTTELPLFETATPFPTSTPTPAPTATSTPLPTPTPLPPITHTIQTGEVLFNIALRYSVSVDSIVAINPGLSPDSVVAGSAINVPLPTATPPLESVVVEINGQSAIADPTDCVLHVIEENDTFSRLSLIYDISLDALLAVNRVTETTLVWPGDTMCIPTITFAAVADASVDIVSLLDQVKTPTILSPRNNASVQADDPILLQWLLERDLAENEAYMIELVGLEEGERPRRVFTKSGSFAIPSDWIIGGNTYRWRVSFVVLDGQEWVTYAYNGPVAESNFTTTP